MRTTLCIALTAIMAAAAMTAPTAQAMDTMVQVNLVPTTVVQSQPGYGPVLDDVYYRWESTYVSRMDSFAAQAQYYWDQSAYACNGQDRSWAQNRLYETDRLMNQETALFQQAVVQRYGFVPKAYYPTPARNVAAAVPVCRQAQPSTVLHFDLTSLFLPDDPPFKHKEHYKDHHKYQHKNPPKAHAKPQPHPKSKPCPKPQAKKHDKGPGDNHYNGPGKGPYKGQGKGQGKGQAQYHDKGHGKGGHDGRPGPPLANR